MENSPRRSFVRTCLLFLGGVMVGCRERSIAPRLTDDDDLSWIQQWTGSLPGNLANKDSFEVQLLISDRESIDMDAASDSVYYYARGGLVRVTGIEGVMRPGRKYMVVRVSQSRRTRSFGGCDIRIAAGPLRGVLLKFWPGDWTHDLVTWAIYCLPRDKVYTLGPIPHQLVSIMAK